MEYSSKKDPQEKAQKVASEFVNASSLKNGSSGKLYR